MKTLAPLLLLAFSTPDGVATLKNGEEAHKRGEYKVALEIFRTLGEEGDADAQHRLGDMYLSGNGVSRDVRKAVEWYTKAAEQGRVIAQANLGAIYNTDFSVLDLDKAVYWYEKASANGDMQSQVALGALLCTVMRDSKDPEKGIRLLENAAEQGNMDAAANLAEYFFTGKVVPRDYVRAEKWVRRLAESGSPDSQFRLGLMYIKAWGLEQNLEEGISWFKRAHESGHAQAALLIGVVCYERNATPEDARLARDWLEKAADRGDVAAMRYLGRIYTEGRGVEKDDVRAWVYFTLGRPENSRDEEAKAMLKEVDAHLSADQRNQAQELLRKERDRIERNSASPPSTRP